MTRPPVAVGSGGVLLLGSCWNTAADMDLDAEERAIAVLQVPTAVVRIGSAFIQAENHRDQKTERAPTALQPQINIAMGSIDCKVVKIGAILSKEDVKTVSELVNQNSMNLESILDLRLLYKSESGTQNADMFARLQEELLPHITLVYATVPEVMQLLKSAGIPANHPRGIPDVQAMAMTLAQKLGPQYVVIHRQFVDVDDGAITLHYVLVDGSSDAQPPVLATFRFENPRRLTGASNCVPSVIAAYLSMGRSVPEAVSAGFRFVERVLTGEGISE